MMELIPAVGGVATTLLAFVVALSVIVAIHEYGHYIVGRWSGIKADVFSIGFGPVLFSRTDRHGTKWQLAALPLGGFVKFAGDSNAASGKDADAMEGLSDEERRHTMHGAPLWARSATVAAGPIFNFILSILVFGAIIMSRGEVAEPLTVGELHPTPAGINELQPGDSILAIAGMPVPAFEDSEAFEAFGDAIPEDPVLDYTVLRAGTERSVQGPYPYPPIVLQVAPQSAALRAGLAVDDVITAIDGAPIFAFDQLKRAVEGSDGRTLQLAVWRAGETLDFDLTPRRVDEPQADNTFETNWRIGIAGGMVFEPATEPMGPFEALGAGVSQTINIVEGSLSGLYHMVTGAISSCNLSGPIGIAEVSGTMASQGVMSFIWFIAVLSTAVGLLNLFPIPVLDGGHLLFYAYEAVAGSPPSDRSLQVMMAVGLSLILTLMGFALFNDIFCP